MSLHEGAHSMGSFLSYQWLKFSTLWLLCPHLPTTETLTTNSPKISVVEIHFCVVGIAHDIAHYQPQLTVGLKDCGKEETSLGQ